MRLFVLAKGKLGVSAFAFCEPCSQPFDPVPPHPCSHGCARPQRGTNQIDIFRREPDAVIPHEAYGTIVASPPQPCPVQAQGGIEPA
jgi:hypothetical protein